MTVPIVYPELPNLDASKDCQNSDSESEARKRDPTPIAYLVGDVSLHS